MYGTMYCTRCQQVRTKLLSIEVKLNISLFHDAHALSWPRCVGATDPPEWDNKRPKFA